MDKVRYKGMSAYIAPGLVLKGVQHRVFTFEEIVAVVEEASGLSLAEIAAHTRKRRVVQARFALFYYLHTSARMTMKEIGARMKPRSPYDHTTVLHGKKSWMVDLETRVVPETTRLAEKIIAALLSMPDPDLP